MLDLFCTIFKSAMTVKCLILYFLPSLTGLFSIQLFSVIVFIYSNYNGSEYTKIHVKHNFKKWMNQYLTAVVATRCHQLHSIQCQVSFIKPSSCMYNNSSKFRCKVPFIKPISCMYNNSSMFRCSIMCPLPIGCPWAIYKLGGTWMLLSFKQ